MDYLLKTFRMFTMFSLIFVLSSCIKIEHVSKDDIKQNMDKAMECIVNEDAEGLLQFFTDDIKENDATNSLYDIQRLFERIDGKIVSYDYEDVSGTEEHVSKGDILEYSCLVRYIVNTDTEKTYRIRFLYQYIWDEHPEYEGIHLIRVCEGNNSDELIIGRDYYDK